MITFFTTFKSFGPRERHALASWVYTGIGSEVLFYAAAKDAARISKDTGARAHTVPATNGRPHVDAMFRHADATASNKIRAYVNSDIMLTPRIWHAVTVVGHQLPSFMITSQRWDVQFDVDLDMDAPDWSDEAERYTEEHGVLHPTSGMDIFCWRGEPWGPGCSEIPPYIVGCYAWDTDLMCMALESGVPVVDITQAVPYGVIHQNHRLVNRRDSPEAQHNMALLGRFGDWRQRLRGTQHATHVLERDLTLRRK